MAGDKYQKFVRNLANTDFVAQGPSDDVEFTQSEIDVVGESLQFLPAFDSNESMDLSMMTLDAILSLDVDSTSSPINSIADSLLLVDRVYIESLFFSLEHISCLLILNSCRKFNEKNYDEAVSRGPKVLISYLRALSSSSHRETIIREARRLAFHKSTSKPATLARCTKYIKDSFNCVFDSAKLKWENNVWLRAAVGFSAFSAAGFGLYSIIKGFQDDEVVVENQSPVSIIRSELSPIVEETFVLSPESVGIDGRARGSGKKGHGRKTGMTRQQRATMNERSDGSHPFFTGESNSQSVPIHLDDPVGAIAQGGADQNAVEIINKVASKSLYMIKPPASEKRVGCILVLRGHIAIMPYHFVTYFKRHLERGTLLSTDSLRLCSKYIGAQDNIKVPIQYFINVQRNEKLEQNDLCVIKLPPTLPMHPDICKYFVAKDVLDRVLDFDNVCMVTPHDRMGIREKYCRAILDEHTRVESGSDSYYLEKTLHYKAFTEEGDCGSILTLCAPLSSPGRIVGFHLAGHSNGIGVAAYVTREDIVSASNLISDVAAPDAVSFTPQCLELPFSGNFIPYFKTEKGLFTPPTKLFKAELYGCWGPAKTAPAKLSPFIKDDIMINPMYMAIEKYGDTPKSFTDFQALDVVVSEIWSNWVSNTSLTRRHKPIVFDFETAVLGIPGNEFCRSIPRDTSAGYPHNMQNHPGFPGKTLYFGRDQEYDLTRPQCEALKVEVIRVIEDARKGIREFHVFTDTLKDERRKHEKVAAGKTRLVSACPIALSIATRMYFLDFQMFLMENCVISGSAIGIDVHSKQWDLLSKFLQSRGPHVVAGDYSGFDTKHLVAFLMAVCDLINKFYDDENSDIRRILFAEVYNSIHLCRDTIYQWLLSLPSGHPLTTIINTIINMILIGLCYYRLNPEGPAGMKNFRDHVFYTVYGDDNVLNISPEAIPFFNQHTISKAMLEFNQTYTTEAKDDKDLGTHRKISEITFLKRSFRYDPEVQRFVAPLDIDVVIEIPYWCSDFVNSSSISKTNVDLVVHELALHPREVFDKWSKLILKSSQELLGFCPTITSYDLLREIVLSEPEIM